MEKRDELIGLIKGKCLVKITINDTSMVVAPLVIGNIEHEEHLMGYYVDSISWVANEDVGQQKIFKIEEIQELEKYSDMDGFTISSSQRDLERQFDEGSVLLTYYSDVED